MEKNNVKKIYFIPARAGSKGIPEKNIKKLKDKPLISWIIDTIVNSETADEIWVATNCPKTKHALNKCYGNKIKIYHRSEESARDESPTIDVVLEFLRKEKVNHKDFLILMQATSPFTPVSLLKTIGKEIDKSPGISLISCYKDFFFRWTDEGIPIDYDIQNKPRRQDFTGHLIESGALYGSPIGNILSSRALLSGVIRPIEVSKVRSIDIDTIDDWYIAEALAEKLY